MMAPLRRRDTDSVETLGQADLRRKTLHVEWVVNMPSAIAVAAVVVSVITFSVVQDRRVSAVEVHVKEAVAEKLEQKEAAKETKDAITTLTKNQIEVMTNQQTMIKTLDRLDRKR